MKTALYLLHTLSPLHAGTGQSVGAIDLPIARERPTGIPLVPGSSIKGALRARYNEPDKHTIFGPDTEYASEFAGAVQFSDAHLLLLPIRSIAGTFAWVTSPFLLQRFARDVREAGQTIHVSPTVASSDQCIVTSLSLLRVDLTNDKGKAAQKKHVILEDLDLVCDATHEAGATTLANALAAWLFPEKESTWRQTFVERFCIVHDDVMALLLETATEVVARIRLNEESKTVQKGALWYEEALPTESVLYGLLVAAASTEKVVNNKPMRQTKSPDELIASLQRFAEREGMLQLGGKATVGRGACLLHVVGRGAS